MKTREIANITVHSVIDELDGAGLVSGEPEINIITARGEVFSDGDDTVIEYTEKSEGGEVICRLTLLADGRVLLKRSGAVECEITFEENKTQDTLYSVPPYSFDMRVHTVRIRKNIGPHEGDVRLLYLMNVGGRDAKTNMKISFKTK